MPEPKTRPTQVKPETFLDNIEDEQLKADCFTLYNIMKDVSGEPAVMWGTAIVGFGNYNYRYESGHHGNICLIGFSPRKANISIYCLTGAPGEQELLVKLGKYKTGTSCLYIKRLKDVDINVLRALISYEYAWLKAKRNV